MSFRILLVVLVAGVLGMAGCDSGMEDLAVDGAATAQPPDTTASNGDGTNGSGNDTIGDTIPGDDTSGDDHPGIDPGDDNPGDDDSGDDDSGDDGSGDDDLPPLPDLRLHLVSQFAPAGSAIVYTDVWGWLDPSTALQYALVGGLTPQASVLFIINVTHPDAPALTATIEVPGFDVKTWRRYAYTVTGAGDQGQNLGRIVDLSTPASPRVVGAFPSGHNLFIDRRGYLYLEDPGLRIFDLNPDPTNPVLVWDSGHNNGGGHDATVVGDRLYDFHGLGGTHIYDVSNPAAPQRLGSINDPSIRFHHSGWVSKDGRYLFICDEGATGDTPDVTVWDIAQPADPRRVAEISDTTATVHNLYVVEDLAFVSYYTAGFKVYDLADPARPRLLDAYDTAPGVEGERFSGAWGAFPFTVFGHIYVSDITGGLFVFELK